MSLRTALHLHRWAPVILSAIFSFGTLSFWLSVRVHGQAPTAESDAVSLAYLQRRVEDLGDVPAQLGAVRERLVRVEADSAAHGRKLDDIADLEKWLVLGVFGTLGLQILRAFKFRVGLRDVPDWPEALSRRKHDVGAGPGDPGLMN